MTRVGRSKLSRAPLLLPARLATINKSILEPITVGPRSSDPFYVVSYYMKWVTAYWTNNIIKKKLNISIYNIKISIYAAPLPICTL